MIYIGISTNKNNIQNNNIEETTPCTRRIFEDSLLTVIKN